MEFEKLSAIKFKTYSKGLFNNYYARSKLKTEPIVSDLEQRDGTMGNDAAAKAEVLNTFTQEDNEGLPVFEKKLYARELMYLNITSEEAKHVFGKLKTS